MPNKMRETNGTSWITCFRLIEMLLHVPVIDKLLSGKVRSTVFQIRKQIKETVFRIRNSIPVVRIHRSGSGTLFHSPELRIQNCLLRIRSSCKFRSRSGSSPKFHQKIKYSNFITYFIGLVDNSNRRVPVPNSVGRYRYRTLSRPLLIFSRPSTSTLTASSTISWPLMTLSRHRYAL
jgi:hypothetical protein